MKRLSNWYCGVAILFATACLVTMGFGVLDLVLHSWWCIPQSLYGAGFGILASHLAGSTTSERALEKQREMNAELNVVVKDAAASSRAGFFRARQLEPLADFEIERETIQIRLEPVQKQFSPTSQSRKRNAKSAI